MDQIADGSVTWPDRRLHAPDAEGPYVDEITASPPLARQGPQASPHPRHATVDTCGTGGDVSGTFKYHDTRPSSLREPAPRCQARQSLDHLTLGSADVLEALAYRRRRDRASAKAIASGMAFPFRARYHPASRHRGPRRELA
jgi:anthranilate phosphoribosyltransferase